MRRSRRGSQFARAGRPHRLWQRALASGSAAVAIGGTLSILGATPAAAQTELYAAPTATGTHDCSSAANACTLPNAIAMAEATTGAVVVNLAAGTYATQVTIAPASGSPMTALTLQGPVANPPTAIIEPSSLSLNVTPGGNGHFFDQNGTASGDPNTGAAIGVQTGSVDSAAGNSTIASSPASVTIDDLAVDGSNVSWPPPPYWTGISYIDTSGTIENSSVTNIQNFTQGAGDSSVDGVQLESNNTTSTDTVTGNTVGPAAGLVAVSAMAGSSGLLNAAIDDNTITGNITTGTDNTAQVGIAAGGTGNLTVSGNTITDFQAPWNESAVWLDSLAASPSCSVTGNTLTANDNGVSVHGASGCTISGNTISAGSTGIEVGEAFPSDSGSSNNNTLNNNTITATTTVATTSVYNQTGATAQATSTGAPLDGILDWDGTGESLSGNTISGAFGNGLYVGQDPNFFANTSLEGFGLPTSYSGFSTTATLTGDNTYSAPTDVGAGSLTTESAGGLGASTVTVAGGGATLFVDDGGTDMTISNPLVLGDGTSGDAYLIDVDRGTADTWSGQIKLNATSTPYIAAESGQQLVVSGDIVDQTTTPSHPLWLNGASINGFLEISGTGNTYDSGSLVDSGIVQIDNGSVLGTAPVDVNTAATLTGDGSVPGISNNGVVFPAQYTQETAGVLTTTGATDLNSGRSGTFNFYATGLTPGPGGYSQLVADGASIDIDSASLDVGDFYQHPGASFTVVRAIHGGSITGEFVVCGSPLANGATFRANCATGDTLQIHYSSTSVVLTDVTSNGGGGGGGTGPTPPPCPAGSTDCNTGTSSAPGGSTSATSGGVTATASGGTGGITVATYGSDPAGPPTFNSTGQYFDVSLSSPNTFTTVVIDDCAAGGGTTLEWWDPSANAGAGGWASVVGDPGPTYDPGPPPCITVTLDSTTSPSISQLTGTVFGAAVPGGPAAPATSGYWVTGSDGGIFAFGNAGYFGSLPGLHVSVNNIVGIAPSADRGGYWLVGSDGGIFAFGDAAYHGSVPGVGAHVNNIKGIVPTPDGGGYWVVGSDGGIFAFGDAAYHGSLPGLGVHVNDIVGIASTTDGGGYWLVGSDGGIFAFGDAVFHGSMGGQKLTKPVVGMAADPNTGGYWLDASDGGIFAFGGAPFKGSMGGIALNQPVVGMAAASDGSGYWLVAADGGIFAFGPPFEGSVPGANVHVTNIKGMAGT